MQRALRHNPQRGNQLLVLSVPGVLCESILNIVCYLCYRLEYNSDYDEIQEGIDFKRFRNLVAVPANIVTVALVHCVLDPLNTQGQRMDTW